MQGAGFYFHIAPTELWIGGGIYRPAADELRWVRDHIAENHGRLKKIVDARQFRKLFGELAGEQSSRMPRGYPSDHPAEHYLRHKDFLAARELAPAEATKSNFLKTLVESFRSMHPLIRFLNEPISAPIVSLPVRRGSVTTSIDTAAPRTVLASSPPFAHPPGQRGQSARMRSSN